MILRNLTMSGARVGGLALALLLLLSTADAAKKQQEKKLAPPDDPPMTVSVVRSGIAGCEPNCPLWLAAEGRLTAQSPAVFRKALKLAGKKRLPVMLLSPGGDVDAALAIGKLIRERKLDVAVGGTMFSGCKPKDKACKLPKEDKGIYRGIAIASGAYCMSACPFILAAGQKRLTGGGALTGVHQISSQSLQERLTYQEEYRVINGKKKIISRKIVRRKLIRGKVTSTMSRSLRKKLVSYLQTMGVKENLLDLLEKAPPSSIYLLQPAELTATALTNGTDSATMLVAPNLCKTQTPADNCQLAEAVAAP